MSKPKIGWQKYEDIIENQVNSPILESILSKYDVGEKGEEEEYSYTEEETEEQISMIPLSSKMLDDIAMLNNFECWMGHTNFDITPEIKDKLNKIRGIELLKICSRYRFFVGIGRMFNFKDVRKVIDEEITSQEE
tara:strand:+ start:2362 stop:2766 length:405 start_codon:yes stop_codon:yes gene_type:complete